ncbi:MAG: serine/threonine-protein kinase [Verrucomicrobia bacterium]|nr:serine/threonine-protein kinase [Verrucomicrobiota bacterium]
MPDDFTDLVKSVIFGNESRLISQILMDDDSTPEDDLEWIGPYRLIRLLGEGGFGEVWLAEQNDTVRREVALKLLKRGMDSKQVLGRFSLERQALASMAHPNIAALLDAGRTADGRPYFVMDYVQGTSITQWCQEKRLGVNEIVGLFQQICAGLQHAHQKGIIHRDLKPSNVLVAEIDGVVTPKIIDFGIAKATSEQPLDQPYVTRVGHVMGTPLYMSPEQLAGGMDVDTRSDIYSLGVLFYEMLTGSAPHEGKTQPGMSAEEFRRIVDAKPPARPSHRLTEIKRQRGIAPKVGELKSESELVIPADLDWIILKALERERERRYASAALLAADLQSFLRDEPVLARPPSLRYNAGLWVRRNRVVFAAACLCVMALLTGTGVALWQAQAAREAQARAEAEAQRTQQAVSFLTTLLDRVATEVAKGRNPEALKLALDGSEGKIRELKGDPLLQSDLFNRVGWLYQTMGERGLAMPLLKAHAEANTAIYGADSAEAWTTELNYLSQMMQHGARIRVPDMLTNLLVRIEASGKAGGTQWFSAQRLMMQIWDKLRQPAKAQVVAHQVMEDPRLESLSPVVMLLVKLACVKAFEAAQEYELADKILVDSIQLCLSDPTLTDRLNTVHEKRLDVQRSQGNFRRGAELAREEINRRKLQSKGRDPFLIQLLLRLAEFESFLKHSEQAIAVSREALQLALALAPTPEALKLNPDLDTLRSEQMFARFSVANYEYKAGHHEEAVKMSREAYQVADEEGNKSNLAEAMLQLAEMQEKTGDLEGAYSTYELREQRSATGGANYQRWHEDLKARCSIRLRQGRAKEAMLLAQELWVKEIKSPDAVKDTGHLVDVAELAILCHEALFQKDPQTPIPAEFAQWKKLMADEGKLPTK